MQSNTQSVPSCPLFFFDVNVRQGELYNPINGHVILEFPKQTFGYNSYPLHGDSVLSPDFARYLYYLVTEHILFSALCSDTLISVETADDLGQSNEPNDTTFSEFSTVWLRAPLEIPELPDYYDSIGFCFLDGALYTPLYCNVIESNDPCT